MIRRLAALGTWLHRFLSACWERLCGRLDFQEKVVGPVIVNLLTAFTIFVILAVAKDAIYPLVLPRPSGENYPIHVTAEAFTLPDGQVRGEVYIANLTFESFSGAGLRDWLEQHKGINPRPADDHIFVSWRRSDGHMKLSSDDHFNAGKGKLEFSPSADGRTWGIRITDINPAALLKIDVITDYAAPTTRSDKFGLPFAIESPRRN